MKRERMEKHPGIRLRTWESPTGKTERRYDASYRDAAGKKHDRSFRKLSAAEAWLRHERDQVAVGNWNDPAKGRIRLESFYASWMKKAQERGKPRARTLLEYDSVWQKYIAPVIGKKPLSTITMFDIEELLGPAGEISAWRHNDALKVVRAILGAAVRSGHIARNPATGIQMMHVDQDEPWILSPEEVNRITELVPERYQALVLIAAYGSLRWSEIVALRLPNVDLMRDRIRVDENIVESGRLIPGEPKTKRSRRWVTLPHEIALVIAEHIRRFPPNDDGLIFTAERGGPIRRPAFGRLVWRPAVRRAGLEGFQFKNLRHTGATLALEEGISPVLVAFRLGHTTTRMIETTYGRLLESMDAEIASRISGRYPAGRPQSTEDVGGR